MKTRIRLESLTLIGARKNYSVQFKDGFNLISGPTSTGKTSILEMIDYALGAKSHKSYIEIGNSCSQVELVLYIGKEKYPHPRHNSTDLVLFFFSYTDQLMQHMLSKRCPEYSNQLQNTH